MKSTGIEWTDTTWNPVRGCSRVSEGCRHCYAERMAARFAGPGQPYEGLLVHLGGKPARWNGVVRLAPEHLADPLRWRKPRRVFVNSMSDLFHEALSNEDIAAVFGVMAAAPRHTFQVLTKRARRMREWFAWMATSPAAHAVAVGRIAARTILLKHGAKDDAAVLDRLSSIQARDAITPVWPLHNVWIGVSVENQAAADERIPDLLATPAALRFLSCEPLLERVDLSRWLACQCYGGFSRSHNPSRGCPAHDVGPHLGWLIAGCESGPGARPAQVDWYRALRDQCAAAGVPFFLKQINIGHGNVIGASPATTRQPWAVGVGSKIKLGGIVSLPYLDGVQHTAFPVTR